MDPALPITIVLSPPARNRKKMRGGGYFSASTPVWCILCVVEVRAAAVDRVVQHQHQVGHRGHGGRFADAGWHLFVRNDGQRGRSVAARDRRQLGDGPLQRHHACRSKATNGTLTNGQTPKRGGFSPENRPISNNTANGRFSATRPYLIRRGRPRSPSTAATTVTTSPCGNVHRARQRRISNVGSEPWAFVR